MIYIDYVKMFRRFYKYDSIRKRVESYLSYHLIYFLFERTLGCELWKIMPIALQKAEEVKAAAFGDQDLVLWHFSKLSL